MADLTAIILTYNEEKNIEKCIKSILDITKRIIVVDSYSTDNTVTIAEELGAEIYYNRFVNYATQFKFGLDNTEINTNWILRIDADERLSEAAAKELDDVCTSNDHTDINGVIIPFEVTFLGKKLRHGGIYPFKKLLVFKYGKGNIESRHMDEHSYITEGTVHELKNISYHDDYKDLTTWIDKHNKYSSREVLDFFEQETTNIDAKLLDRKAKFKRFLKYDLYYRLPMGVRSYSYFFYRYYIKLGFLDGKEGKIFAFLQAYWYRFLVDAKIFEQEKTRKQSNEKNID